MLEIAVLVSAGRHPASGRARRAPNDARALELALALAARCPARVRVLHAGSPSEPALSGYLGMGIEELHVLPVPDGTDIVPPLLAALRGWRPDLILTGARAEAGWSSGCLPYLLAEALSEDLCPNIDGIIVPDGGTGTVRLELRQVCPGGRRRRLHAAVPLVATVDPAAPVPRQSAFARSLRGRLAVTSWKGAAPKAPSPGEPYAARKRPRRLRDSGAGASAGERLQALTSAAAGAGRRVETTDARAAARTILAYLIEHGLLDAEAAPAPAVPAAQEG